MGNLKFIENILVNGVEYTVYQYEGNIWDFDGCLQLNPDVVIKSYVEDNKGYHFKGQVCSLGDDVAEFIKRALEPTFTDYARNFSLLLFGRDTEIAINDLRAFYLTHGWAAISREFWGCNDDTRKSIEKALGIEQEPKQAVATISAEKAIEEAISAVKSDGYEAFDYYFSSLYNGYGSEAAIQFRELCKKENIYDSNLFKRSSNHKLHSPRNPFQRR